MLAESRILIVDDNRDLLDDWEEILLGQGANVQTASTGAKGLALMQHPFDVALVDVRLPDVEGTRLVPEFRQASPDSEILLITGHGTMEAAIDAVRANVYDYLLKPVSPEQLLSRVGRAYEHVLMKRETYELRNALEEESHFNARLVETAQAIILVLGLDGTVIRLNPYMEDLCGYASEEAVGKDWFETFLPERDRERIRAVFRDASGGEIIRGNVNPIQTKNGEERLIEWAASPLTDADGRAVGVLSTGIDITERRRTEAELRHAQKMESVGSLASGVAHDFNNLLMGILGCTELALRRLDPKSEAREYLDEVRMAAASGETIVRQLMAFARKEPMATDASPVDPDRLLTEMVGLIRRLLGEDVNVRISPAAPNAAIRLGPGQLEQVILNLVVNARHAMPDGGELTLATEEVRAEGEDGAEAGSSPGGYLILTVRDTGCGIPEAVQERVFEPFFTTKGPEEGTGLGLSTVFGVVQRAGGTIELESEVGTGTTFRIRFPKINPSTVPESIDQVALGDVRGTETVLVVEDDRLVRTTLAHYLKGAGYAVLMATDAREALTLVDQRGESIDVVLTDMLLPGGATGADLAEQVTANVPSLHTILMSAHPKDELVRIGRVSPRVEYLQKPFSERAVLAKVRDLLDGTSPGGTPSPTASRVGVLVVEDQGAARLAMRDLLEDSGYEAFDARNGQEALALFEAHGSRIQLILTDIGLPDMDGTELVRELRLRVPEVAAIYITGRSADDPSITGVSDTRTVVLTKPVDWDLVARAIRSLVAGPQHGRDRDFGGRP